MSDEESLYDELVAGGLTDLFQAVKRMYIVIDRPISKSVWRGFPLKNLTFKLAMRGNLLFDVSANLASHKVAWISGNASESTNNADTITVWMFDCVTWRGEKYARSDEKRAEHGIWWALYMMLSFHAKSLQMDLVWKDAAWIRQPWQMVPKTHAGKVFRTFLHGTVSTGGNQDLLARPMAVRSHRQW